MVRRDAERQARVEQVAGDGLEGGSMAAEAVHAVVDVTSLRRLDRVQGSQLNVTPDGPGSGPHGERDEVAFVPGRDVDRLQGHGAFRLSWIGRSQTALCHRRFQKLIVPIK